MRKLFEFLTLADWITPSIGFIEDILNDPTLLQSNTWTFFIPYDQAINAGWNARAIEGLMGRHGIQYWGSQFIFPNGQFFFKVKLEQAQWAEYVLLRNGVPINKRFLGAPRPKKKGKSSPPKKHEPSVQKAVQLFDDFLKNFR